MTKQKQALDLTVGVRDFGPIAEGEITLKPLTILVGPNNSGKSYAAMLLHSIFEACFPAAWFTGMPSGFRHVRVPFHGARTRSFTSDELAEIPALRAGQSVSLPKETTGCLLEAILKQTWEHELGDELKRSMGCQLDDLVSIGTDSFHLRIRSSRYSTEVSHAKKLELTTADVNSGDMEVRIEAARSDQGFTESLPTPTALQIRVPAWSLRESERGDLFGSVLSDSMSRFILQSTARPCYYLPAARSGILQGHRALAASIIRRAPFLVVEPFEAPGLSGVVADFLSMLLSLPEEEGKLHDLAQELEREVMKGEITLHTPRGEVPREIKYRYRDTDIPLHRSSSTVSELAPLVLYLKYVVSPGSVLIIEEPEAHLHPANQRVIAKYLAQLVGRGVHVVITTHSDWLVEQLSNIVKLTSMTPQARARKFHGLKDAVLAPEDVGAYVFSYDAKSRGHRIQAIQVDEDGIPEDEFLRIHEELYEESIAIEKAREKR